MCDQNVIRVCDQSVMRGLIVPKRLSQGRKRGSASELSLLDIATEAATNRALAGVPTKTLRIEKERAIAVISAFFSLLLVLVGMPDY